MNKNPDFLTFLSKNDFNFVVYLRQLEKQKKYKELKQAKEEKKYNYEKYEWQVCLDALRTYEIYTNYILPNIQQMKHAGIKKVKLLCDNKCKCCEKLKKGIKINEIVELPRVQCELKVRHCIGASYLAIINYND